MRNRLFICVMVALSVSLVSGEPRAEADSDRGSIIYGKGKSLWRVPASGGDAKRIAKLGFAARRITALRSSLAGTALLVSTKRNHYWVVPKPGEAKKPAVVRHVCRGKASMSADGRAVLCQKKDGSTTVQAVASGEITEAENHGVIAAFAGHKNNSFVVRSATGIEAISLAGLKGPVKKSMLSALIPKSDLLIAPDGKRAVAVFREQDGTPSLYSFLLDGSGNRRKLVNDATPVAWSSDSAWLAVTRKKRGCVVRAAGGQYRCFSGFRALGISPDHKDALLARGSAGALTILRADLGGARSSKPVTVVPRAQGSAIWVSTGRDSAEQ